MANIETDNVLDCWPGCYFERGRFPGSQELIMVPQAETSKSVKTYMPLSPIDLYQKFKGTDAKGLVSIQALAALNLHLGSNKIISKNALTEFLHNLTFKALSKENDNIYLSFDNIGLLVLDILERLSKLDLEPIKETKIMNKNIKEEVDKTLFEPELRGELEMQKDLENFINSGKELILHIHFTSTLIYQELKVQCYQNLNKYHRFLYLKLEMLNYVRIQSMHF